MPDLDQLLEFALELVPRLQFDARLNVYGTLLVFLPAVVIGYWTIRGTQARLLFLSAASLLFYSFWDWRFAPLLVLSAAADYVCALKAAEGEHRNRWLWASVAFNLGLLGVFKYLLFAAVSVNSLAELLGASARLPVPAILLPVGISFFTFQTLSYTIDSWRGTVRPTRNFVQVLAYVSLFPQLVAGPIVRFGEVGDDLTRRRRLDRAEFFIGLERLCLGLVKKVLLADQLALRIDQAWAPNLPLSSGGALVAMAGFTLQIYLDIAAYSDMAVGVGRMMGFRFPENFNRPFTSRNPVEFWQRNHISLSRFIRDYLYVPLGGNRGSAWIQTRTLLLAFGLSGLWHGASWTFVIWGLVHGLALAAHRFVGGGWGRLPKALQQMGWMAFHIATMALFRASTVADAAHVWRSAVSGNPGWQPSPGAILLVAGGYLVAMTPLPSFWARLPGRVRYAAFGGALGLTLFLMNDVHRPFEYFQF